MPRYYTRACNFYYGNLSKKLVKQNQSFPVGGNQLISFDSIEIITKKSKKKISIKKIKYLNNDLRKKIKIDLRNIIKKKKFKGLNMNLYPNIMGVLNITPDSFSDGGRYFKDSLAKKRLNSLFRNGANIVDVGGESTRPGSKPIDFRTEWKRVKKVLQIPFKKKIISLDTRKSIIMEKGIKKGVKIINDVSGLNYDKDTISVLKKYKTTFILHHSLGNPDKMQKNPKYQNVLLDIYDFFEKKINFLRAQGIKHNNIIIDPGIGFGKNLKHNITILKNISIYHSLGFPILLGISRKRFIKELSGENDSNSRIGGTIASSLFAIMQGVQMLRVHDVNEIKQSIKVFKKLIT